MAVACGASSPPQTPAPRSKRVFDEEAVQTRIQGFHRKDGAYDVAHRNLYDVHQRVASSYRDGRLLIAGDAAHINNPLGGMGMNFGIHDAFNLADRLGEVIQDGASDDRLDLVRSPASGPSRRIICKSRRSKTKTTSNKKIRRRATRSISVYAPLSPTVMSCAPICDEWR